MLVPDCGEVYGAVKELLNGSRQLKDLEEIDSAVREGLIGDVLPEMFFGGDDGEYKLAQRDALPCAALANRNIAAFDIAFRFVLKPLTQVAVDFIGALPKFFSRNTLTVPPEAQGICDPRPQTVRQRVSIRFDEANDIPTQKPQSGLLWILSGHKHPAKAAQRASGADGY